MRVGSATKASRICRTAWALSVNHSSSCAFISSNSFCIGFWRGPRLESAKVSCAIFLSKDFITSSISCSSLLRLTSICLSSCLCSTELALALCQSDSDMVSIDFLMSSTDPLPNHPRCSASLAATPPSRVAIIDSHLATSVLLPALSSAKCISS